MFNFFKRENPSQEILVLVKQLQAQVKALEEKAAKVDELQLKVKALEAEVRDLRREESSSDSILLPKKLNFDSKDYVLNHNNPDVIEPISSDSDERSLSQRIREESIRKNVMTMTKAEIKQVFGSQSRFDYFMFLITEQRQKGSKKIPDLNKINLKKVKKSKSKIIMDSRSKLLAALKAKK